MSVTREFYLTRADECAAEAAAAPLENVRERALRSEAAWRAMAQRMQRVEAQRVIAEATRQERIAGEVERIATVDRAAASA